MPLDAKYWLAEIKAAQSAAKKWHDTAQKVYDRFRDEDKGGRNARSRFNILWSNIQTLKPATYSRRAEPQVTRRHADKDPVARLAAEILERALAFESEYREDVHNAIDQALTDHLLTDFGIAWARFDAQFAPQTEGQDGDPGAYKDDDGKQAKEAPPDILTSEVAAIDYVHWRDFLWSPARCWDEVRWVARGTYLTKDRVAKRFGADRAARIPYMHEPKGFDKTIAEQYGQHMKQARIWEVWHKDSKTVFWVADGAYQEGGAEPELLDEQPDFLQLDGFWPCPKPMSMAMGAGKMEPVPDYTHYEDQAVELNRITHRIDRITEAIRANALANGADAAKLKRLFSGDNELIPIDDWPAFQERGGFDGMMQFMPIDMLAKVRQILEQSRESTKQVIYEITGISDIIRGSTQASETATAQRIKGQFAGIRLSDRQGLVSKFATECFRKKAEIMATQYRPETLMRMSAADQLIDMQDSEQVAILEAALALLKDEPSRQFRIEVDDESFKAVDEEEDKKTRVEFLTTMGAFFQQMVPLLQFNPAFAPMVREMILFAARGFKAGRMIEPAIETALEALQQPDPAQAMQQAQQQIEQERQGLEREKDMARRELGVEKQAVDVSKRELQLAGERMANQAMQAAMPGMGMPA